MNCTATIEKLWQDVDYLKKLNKNYLVAWFCRKHHFLKPEEYSGRNSGNCVNVIDKIHLYEY